MALKLKRSWRILRINDASVPYRRKPLWLMMLPMHDHYAGLQIERNPDVQPVAAFAWTAANIMPNIGNDKNNGEKDIRKNPRSQAPTGTHIKMKSKATSG